MMHSLSSLAAADEVVVLGRHGHDEITVSDVIAQRGGEAPNGLAMAVQGPRVYGGRAVDRSTEVAQAAVEVFG